MSLLTDPDQVRQIHSITCLLKQEEADPTSKTTLKRKEADLNIRMLKLWGRVDGVSITQNISYICPDKLSKSVEVPYAISLYQTFLIIHF